MWTWRSTWPHKIHVQSRPCQDTRDRNLIWYKRGVREKEVRETLQVTYCDGGLCGSKSTTSKLHWQLALLVIPLGVNIHSRMFVVKQIVYIVYQWQIKQHKHVWLCIWAITYCSDNTTVHWPPLPFSQPELVHSARDSLSLSNKPGNENSFM